MSSNSNNNYTNGLDAVGFPDTTMTTTRLATPSDAIAQAQAHAQQSRHSHGQIKQNSHRPKSVRFSSTPISVNHIPCPTQEQLDCQWTSPQDQRNFLRDIGSQVQSARRIFATKPPTEITTDDIRLCVGIESFMTQELALTTMRKRREHTRAVFEEQARQQGVLGRHGGGEDLRRVSEIHSRWSRERARMVAAGYVQMEYENVDH